MQKNKMAFLILLLTIFFLPSNIHGWASHHLQNSTVLIPVMIQAKLTDKASAAVKELLPDYAEGDLSSVCSWADQIKFRYHWSSPLHYIDTPDGLCNYEYNRDCKDENGNTGVCVSGAISNYTKQLLGYNQISFLNESSYNLTEALLFLSHFMGDIHQPLHVGFTTDRGGNTIDVHWFKRKTELHHVWDFSIIETEEEKYYESNVDDFIDELNRNITGNWADQVPSWETCSENTTASCPDLYASESVSSACDWAYRDVTEGSTLEDEYFLTRSPIVNLRLAQGGIRLAAALNRAFA